MTCPKCAGCLWSQFGESRCLNCGYREGDLTREIGREGVSADVLDGLCVSCLRQPRMLHRRCCKSCLYKASKRAQRLRAEARLERQRLACAAEQAAMVTGSE